MIKPKNIVWFFPVLAFCFATMGILFKSHLFLDGARVFTEIMGGGALSIDFVKESIHLRFTSLLLRLPLFISVTYFDLSDQGMAQLLFAAPYHILQVVTLVWGIRVFSKNRPQLLYIQFFSYLFLLLPTSFFLISYAYEIYAYFWMLLIVHHSKNKYKNFWLYFISIVLALSYEATFPLLIVMGIINFKDNRRLGVFQFLLGLSVFLYIFVIAPELRQNLTVERLLQSYLGRQNLFYISPLILMAGMSFFKVRLHKSIYLLTYSTYLYIFYRYGYLYIDPYSPYLMKNFVSPGLCLIFLVIQIKDIKLIRIQIVTLALMSLPNIITFSKISYEHWRATGKLKNELFQSNTDCVYMKKERFKPTYEKYAIASTSLHLYSLALADNLSIKTIAFTDVLNWENNQYGTHNVCNSKNANKEFILLPNIFNNKYIFSMDSYPRYQFSQ